MLNHVRLKFKLRPTISLKKGKTLLSVPTTNLVCLKEVRTVYSFFMPIHALPRTSNAHV